MNKIIIIIGLVSIIGCAHDSVDSFENYLPGHYKIVSIESDASVDLNNDGLKSENLFDEISNPYYTIDGKRVSFYDFDSPSNYMEIRPLAHATNDAKFIAINFPDQYIDRLADGKFYLVAYLKSFINYSYKVNANTGNIELINNNPEYTENGNLKSFQLQHNREVKLKLTKRLFDFTELKWTEVGITAVYQKVDNL